MNSCMAIGLLRVDEQEEAKSTFRCENLTEVGPGFTSMSPDRIRMRQRIKFVEYAVWYK